MSTAERAYADGRADQAEEDMQLLAWAYNKLTMFSFVKQEDALNMGRIREIFFAAAASSFAKREEVALAPNYPNLMQFARSQGGHNTAVAVQVVLDVENAKIAQAVFDPDAKNTPLRKAIRGAIHRWMTGNHVREDESLAEAVAVAVMPLVPTPLGGSDDDEMWPSGHHNDTRLPIHEVLEIVESYGPWGKDINGSLQFQIILADEVKKLRAALADAMKDAKPPREAA